MSIRRRLDALERAAADLDLGGEPVLCIEGLSPAEVAVLSGDDGPVFLSPERQAAMEQADGWLGDLYREIGAEQRELDALRAEMRGSSDAVWAMVRKMRFCGARGPSMGPDAIIGDSMESVCSMHCRPCIPILLPESMIEDLTADIFERLQQEAMGCPQ